MNTSRAVLAALSQPNDYLRARLSGRTFKFHDAIDSPVASRTVLGRLGQLRLWDCFWCTHTPIP